LIKGVGALKVSPFPKKKETASIFYRKILDKLGKKCNLLLNWAGKEIHRIAAITCPMLY